MLHSLSLLLLLSSPGAGAAGGSTAPAPDTSPSATRLVDLDGDGALDVLAQHADGSLAVRLCVGPRRFEDVVQELPRVPVTDALVSDLDGDGLPDLYLVSPGPDVALLGLGAGRFREASAELGLVESGPGLSAERLDVDADGLEDLVLHNQGSDVLFWARADGRFEREPGTADGAPLGGVSVLGGSATRPGGDTGAGLAAADTGLTGSRGDDADRATPGSGSLSGLGGSPAPVTVSTSTSAAPPATSFGDARFVNDNMNEVDSADILDGSLTGADVSTSGGNVTFGGGATVTARKGVFGQSVSASGPGSTVSGGYVNTASSSYSTVSGGATNTASAYYSTVSGGANNTALGLYSTVSGGADNTASGGYSTVSGGRDNTAQGFFSFAAGRRAKANHNGSFVWGDSVSVDKLSSTDNEFSVYAEGGARIFAVGQTTPSMVVSPSGSVGIGTATPGSSLHVAGTRTNVSPAAGVHAGVSGSSMGLEIAGEGTISNVDFSVGDQGDYGARLRYQSSSDLLDVQGANFAVDGSVGIGTTSPTQMLSVAGDAGKPGGGSWSMFSDARLKKNVEDLEGALDTLLALRGVTFEYKDPEAIGELSGERIGFIAQEVEAVLPDWVEENASGYKQLTIRGFEALAVEALRELRAADQEREETISSLQRENAALLAANEELQGANEELQTRVEHLESMQATLAGLREVIASLAESR